ncbi:MAG: flagellar biosynthesis protein FliQ [Nitrospirae bacterium]|uniref:Flagellar biosynthetic protein FliQ n=1 Tax=Leptospirillum ferrodiazotrophum TaxID=412449 RepID=C6HWM2_9BACT|nr:MAG: flagellar biosynthetic protein FliQ [Leptospirillum ferrodiazotrophum]MCL5954304.1 flagellar biosynthesis protein FliQ [Nitrospirota bacterium]
MEIQTAVDLTHEAMRIALVITLPILLVSLVVGVVVSLLQAVTQINEMTLSFLPKVAAVGGVLLALMPWMVRLMVDYTHDVFASLPGLVR